MTGYFRRVKVLALINCVTMHLLPYLNYIGAKLTLETTTTIQWSILVTADDLIDLPSERPKSNHLIGSQSPLLPSFPTTVRRLSYSPSSTGLAKEWALGCVNPASRLPLVAGASSRNLGPALSPSPVEPFIYKTLLGILAISRLIVQTIYIYLNKAIYYIPLYCWFKSRSTLYIGCHLLYIRALPLSCFSSQS